MRRAALILPLTILAMGTGGCVTVGVLRAVEEGVPYRHVDWRTGVVPDDGALRRDGFTIESNTNGVLSTLTERTDSEESHRVRFYFDEGMGGARRLVAMETSDPDGGSVCSAFSDRGTKVGWMEGVGALAPSNASPGLYYAYLHNGQANECRGLLRILDIDFFVSHWGPFFDIPTLQARWAPLSQEELDRDAVILMSLDFDGRPPAGEAWYRAIADKAREKAGWDAFVAAGEKLPADLRADWMKAEPGPMSRVLKKFGLLQAAETEGLQTSLAELQKLYFEQLWRIDKQTRGSATRAAIYTLLGRLSAWGGMSSSYAMIMDETAKPVIRQLAKELVKVTVSLGSLGTGLSDPLQSDWLWEYKPVPAGPGVIDVQVAKAGELSVSEPIDWVEVEYERVQVQRQETVAKADKSWRVNQIDARLDELDALADVQLGRLEIGAGDRDPTTIWRADASRPGWLVGTQNKQLTISADWRVQDAEYQLRQLKNERDALVTERAQITAPPDTRTVSDTAVRAKYFDRRSWKVKGSRQVLARDGLGGQTLTTYTIEETWVDQDRSRTKASTEALLRSRLEHPTGPALREAVLPLIRAAVERHLQGLADAREAALVRYYIGLEGDESAWNRAVYGPEE